MGGSSNVDYDALAKQQGGAANVDYDALAAQHGGIASPAAKLPAGLSPQDIQDIIAIRAKLPAGDPRAAKIDRLLTFQTTEKMVSPDGQIHFVSPSEVDALQAAGHTLIQPNGNYRVMPMPDESFSEVAQRAMNVAKALGPEAQQQAIQSEGRTNIQNLKSADPRRNPLVAAPLIGFTGAAGLTGLGEGGLALFGPSAVPVAGGTGFGGAAAGTTAGPSLVGGALTAAGRYALANPTATASTILGLGYALSRWLRKQ